MQEMLTGLEKRQGSLVLSLIGFWVVILSLSSFFPLLSGIPLLGFLFVLPLTIPWARLSESWLGVVHYLACIFPQLGSVLYHLFMNHEGGPAVYHTLLTLDMCGVCMVNTLGELKRSLVIHGWLTGLEEQKRDKIAMRKAESGIWAGSRLRRGYVSQIVLALGTEEPIFCVMAEAILGKSSRMKRR